jgi:hypothetical protein
MTIARTPEFVRTATAQTLYVAFVALQGEPRQIAAARGPVRPRAIPVMPGATTYASYSVASGETTANRRPS